MRKAKPSSANAAAGRLRGGIDFCTGFLQPKRRLAVFNTRILEGSGLGACF